jgi:hypothetical protein
LQNPIRTAKRNGAELRDWIWIIVAAVVLAAGLHCSRLTSVAAAFRVPATPLDLTSEHAARLWGFLMEARDTMPAGASYTVEAQDRDDEMTLYMFSLGIFFKQEALPSSYFGVATPDFGRRARFVLVYGAAPSRVAQARLVRAVPSGAIYDRGAA